MLFFKDIRKSRLNQIDLWEVRQRVHGIRQVGDRPISLTNLFAMIGEDDRIRSLPPTKAEPVIKRLRPDQVP